MGLIVLILLGNCLRSRVDPRSPSLQMMRGSEVWSVSVLCTVGATIGNSSSLGISKWLKERTQHKETMKNWGNKNADCPDFIFAHLSCIKIPHCAWKYCECQLPLLSFATIDTITAICMVTGVGKAGKKPTGMLLSFIAFHAFMAGKLKVTLLLLSLLLLIFYFVLSCE